MESATESPPVVSKRSLGIAAFSTVVEWYDFSLSLYLAPVLARVFFQASSNAIAVALGGFALAYLMRPLGAMFFGYCGDRWGRRSAMLWSMQAMACAMLLTALLPSSARIGPAAGILLLALRCAMSFSVGGEYNGVIAYLLEGSAPARRGFLTALAAASSEVGGLLAVALAALTTAVLSDAALDAWGWRIPFVVGAVLAGGVWLSRRTMAESPPFLALAEAGALGANPLVDALRSRKIGIARAFAVSALGSITYYVGITYVPTFLATTAHVREGTALGISTFAALAIVLVTPAIGWAADAFGRRPVLVALAVACVALPAALFSTLASSTTIVAVAAALVLALLAGGVSAVGPIASAEQFPIENRLSGLALGNTGATVLFGGLAPLLAHLAVEKSGWPSSPGIMIAVTALAVLPVFLTMPETKPTNVAADASAKDRHRR